MISCLNDENVENTIWNIYYDSISNSVEEAQRLFVKTLPPQQVDCFTLGNRHPLVVVSG